MFAWSRGKVGRFAKGKIHCSCWYSPPSERQRVKVPLRMCRSKSHDELSQADKKKLLAARQQLNEEVPRYLI